MTKAKSKKIVNVTFPIVTNKVSTQEGFSVIEAARQNILVTFLLKNISEKLSLMAFGLFSSSLAGSSSPVKVPSKKHTQVSPNIVFITFKNPKIFNNRLVNKLVFSVLTTFTITTTSTALQMAVKAKNSKKQQQAVTTTMVIPNPFVVPDEIFGKISTTAASSLLNMDNNSSSISPKMGQDQPLAVLLDVVLFSRLSPIPVAKQPIISDDFKDWADQMEMESTAPSLISENVNGHQKFSGWVAFNLLLPSCIGLKSVLQDAVKLFCVEFASQESLNGATKVAIGDKIFLTTLKIAWFSGVTSVSSSSLLVALHNVPLGTSSDDIKSALGIFGVVISIKLKPAGLWQYAVIYFKDTSSAAAALTYWSVLIRKDSVKIFPVVNQNNVISSRDTLKLMIWSPKLVAIHVLFFASLNLTNVPCMVVTSGEKLLDVATAIGRSSFFLPKLSSNTFGGPRVFKPLFAESKSYAKAAVFVIPPVTATADMNLDLGDPSKTTTPILPVVFSAFNIAVKSRLASLESYLSELSVLIKFLVEPVGILVVLVTKLLFTSPAVDASVKECVAELANQNKDLAAVASMMQKKITYFEKKCEQACLKDAFDDNNIVDNNNNNNKNFSVYDDIFDVIMYLWKDQSSSIKSSPD
ncbi:hypothetical protein G9A89_018657 [Geosiphon pyriformis]|nr:hypothetical protein G9A89_018657 [Geosiphon pyriformis]